MFIVRANVCRIFLVIGTDTDCGKTVLTAALLRALERKGVKALGVKAVQTGCQTNEIGELIAPDLEVYLKASNAPGKSYFKFRIHVPRIWLPSWKKRALIMKNL